MQRSVFPRVLFLLVAGFLAATAGCGGGSASSVGNLNVNEGTSGGTVATPSALCKDGTDSYSQNCTGTCSVHGGVAVWYNNCASQPTPPLPGQ